MKNKLRLLFVFSLLFSLFGCTKEDDSPIGPTDLHDVVFHAGWAPETKTVLQEDGSVWWSPGDEISLFVGSGSGGGYKLTSTNTNPAAKVDFVGKIGDNPNNATYTAIYPYNENAYCGEDGWIGSTIPEIQYVKPGSFADNQLISFAKSKNNNLYFYNICGGIKFSVANEGITKVVFTSSKSINSLYTRPIAGHFAAYLTDEGDFISGIRSDGSESFTITALPLEGEFFIPGKYYYVAFIPNELPNLLISYYKKDDSFATYILNLELGGRWAEIKRATIKTIAEKDKGLTFTSSDKKYSIIPNTYDFWPTEMQDRSLITEINFHTNCHELKGNIIPSSDGYTGCFPAYVEMNGTVIDFYTEADSYKMLDCVGLFHDFENLKELDLSMFCTDIVKDMTSMFENCKRLETIDLSSFKTENVTSMGAMFFSCKSLKSLDLSGFSSLSMSSAVRMFHNCSDLTKLDLGNFDLSSCGTLYSMFGFARFSKNCAIRCSSATRAKLCDNESGLGSNADYITWVLPEEELPDLEPIVDPNVYTSTDYSKDKTVRVLHKATKGKGVDIVLLGDAYSDRMIADGTYDADMELAMNAILKDEPYSSFKDYINVYTVYAVSKNEIPFETKTVFDASIHNHDPVLGTQAMYEQKEIYKYASIAFPEKDLEDIAMILIINQAEVEGDSDREGVAFFEGWYNEEEFLDYAAHARSIGLINRRNRSQTEYFSSVVAHEFGHIFAKLGDEYVVTPDEITDWEKKYIIDFYTHVGWWSNIDVTSDPQIIKWKKFLEDERYSGTGLGIYEGGYTYAYGVWRPAQSSIMTDNQGMFNAPSREVIYKRIHKLALGKDWQYDYETFVEYDQKNIAAEKAAQSSPSPAKNIPYPARVNGKPLFKMKESTTADGKKMVTVIMN